MPHFKKVNIEEIKVIEDLETSPLGFRNIYKSYNVGVVYIKKGDKNERKTES